MSLAVASKLILAQLGVLPKDFLLYIVYRTFYGLINSLLIVSCVYLSLLIHMSIYIYFWHQQHGITLTRTCGACVPAVSSPTHRLLLNLWVSPSKPPFFTSTLHMCTCPGMLQAHLLCVLCIFYCFVDVVADIILLSHAYFTMAADQNRIVSLQLYSSHEL